MHGCHRCRSTFTSRNKLFRHLKEQCWEEDDIGSHHVTDSTSELANAPKIIESNAPKSSGCGQGTAFRGFQHTKADLRLTPAAPNVEICLDLGCPITLGDRAMLSSLPDFEKRILKQGSPVPVRGYGNKIVPAREYIVMDLYFPGTHGQSQEPVLAKVQMEVHLSDDLKANMLIGTDVLTPHGFRLDCASQKAIIGGCQGVEIAARSTTSSDQVKRVIEAKSTLTLPPNSVMDVPVSYHGSLPEERDFLFEPELSLDLGREGGVFAHIVDSLMTFIQAKNATLSSVKIPRNARLGTVVKYAANKILPSFI